VERQECAARDAQVLLRDIGRDDGAGREATAAKFDLDASIAIRGEQQSVLVEPAGRRCPGSSPLGLMVAAPPLASAPPASPATAAQAPHSLPAESTCACRAAALPLGPPRSWGKTTPARRRQWWSATGR
jgi:hypothetical protein